MAPFKEERGVSATHIRLLMSRLCGLVEATRGAYRELSKELHGFLPPNGTLVQSMDGGHAQERNSRQAGLWEARLEGGYPEIQDSQAAQTPQEEAHRWLEGLEDPQGSYGSRRTHSSVSTQRQPPAPLSCSPATSLPEATQGTQRPQSPQSLETSRRIPSPQRTPLRTSTKAATGSGESSENSGASQTKYLKTRRQRSSSQPDSSSSEQTPPPVLPRTRSQQRTRRTTS